MNELGQAGGLWVSGISVASIAVETALQSQPLLPPQLPRHRTALHDAHDLTAELAVDDWPPRDKGELVRFLDDGELAAGELDLLGRLDGARSLLEAELAALDQAHAARRTRIALDRMLGKVNP